MNLPPSAPHRVLPRGNSLQLKEEEKHLDVLAPLVQPMGEAWTYGTLHALQVQSARAQKRVVEVRIDDRPIGVLTPTMGQHFLPVIDHLAVDGEVTAARVLLKGNALKVEAVLYAARAHELDGSWLAGSAGSSADVVRTDAHGNEGDDGSSGAGLTPSGPSGVAVASTPAALTVADLGTPVLIPPKPSSIVFNPAPGWPAPPAGFEPPAGWQPLPEWPAPPDGWQFWIAR